MSRTFVDKPAVREKVPLLVGVMGPSGGGKTFSALRLATGMQRVTGGEIFGIDTESGRMQHYADRFKFRHVNFAAPFGSLDYLAAVEHCHKRGAGIIIVDSMSHEHEGPGGMLKSHEAEVTRLCRGDAGKANAVKMLAWARPKADRRRLINTLLQIPCNFIFCFRAKEKLKMERGKEPEKMGFMPIAGEEFVFEMTACALLMPNAGGIPTWQTENPGERMMIKQPEQFRALFAERKPIDEALGESMAQWAIGDSTSEFVRLSNALKSADGKEAIDKLLPELKAATEGKKVKDYEAANLRDLYARMSKASSATKSEEKPAETATVAGPPPDKLPALMKDFDALGGDFPAWLEANGFDSVQSLLESTGITRSDAIHSLAAAVKAAKEKT